GQYGPPAATPIQASTDPAALGAGAVAIVVSLFVVPGNFGIINLVVSITLLAVIFGYVWPHRRLPLQSLAVGAAVGLASIPAIGFFDETVRFQAPPAAQNGKRQQQEPGGKPTDRPKEPVKGTTAPLDYLTAAVLTGDIVWDCSTNKCSDSKEPRSNVPDRDLAIGWLAVLAVTYSLDRFRQRLPATTQSEPADAREGSRTVDPS
ncbi:MAG: hypothetical protein ABWY92_19010, partial [Xanthobacteraceae bacterium]